MTTLTLPIVIGKKYVRRDGAVVVAKAADHPISCGVRADVVYIGQEGEGFGSGLHAWKNSGRINCSLTDTPFDLVADYVEPSAAEAVCEGLQTAVAVAALDARIPAPAGHRHAAQMLEYAQDAATHAEPWKLWEKQTDQDPKWIKLSSSPLWSLGHEYRRTPKCIVINGYEVPVPLRVPPAIGIVVYIASPSNPRFAFESEWRDHESLATALKRGLVHATMEAAAVHGCALASFTTTEVAE